jgi:hypothetical protein
MITLRVVFLVLALISFFLATLDVKPPRVNMLGLGLVFWVLSELAR